MLSLLSPPKLKFPLPNLHLHHHFKLKIKCSFSSSNLPKPPPPTPPGQAYQPFRPPPSPLPAKYRSLNPVERLDILRDRLGLWHEYAPLISSLSHDGFTPPSIEEVTGITGVHQNRLSVASRVRDSLISSPHFDPSLVPFFDASDGADILYELRMLKEDQRISAASYVVQLNLDGKGALELARAMKDFPRRRGDDGWEMFAAKSPGDCLAYTHFRLSREALATPDKLASLERAMKTAETEEAKKRITREIEKVSGKGGQDGSEDEEKTVRARLNVVRLRYGEVAEASSVVILPVCKASEGQKGVKEPPEKCKTVVGELGIVEAERGWRRWMVLPGWPPVLGLGGEGGVGVEFPNTRILPWRVNRLDNEAVVVVVDRKKREVGKDDGGFYLVSGGSDGGELEIEMGRKLVGKEAKEVLGAVVLVVRPPKDEDDLLGDEDWD